jgi:hypothetical protein
MRMGEARDSERKWIDQCAHNTASHSRSRDQWPDPTPRPLLLYVLGVVLAAGSLAMIIHGAF